MAKPGVPIRTDVSADRLRELARVEPDRTAATRMLAIACALEGASREAAARTVGMDRQALRDAILRFNKEGLQGLYDRNRSVEAAPASQEWRTANVPAEMLAEFLDVTARRVQQLAIDGIIPSSSEGGYPLLASLTGYIRELRRRASQQDGVAVQRQRLLSARADMAELERAREVGDLVPADDVQMAWVELVALLRSRILGIPSKLAARMPTVKNAAQAKEILETECSAALAELAKTTVKVAPRARPPAPAEHAGVGAGSSPATAAADSF